MLLEGQILLVFFLKFQAEKTVQGFQKLFTVGICWYLLNIRVTAAPK